MEAIPDSGARIATNYVAASPYLRFKANFAKTGTHYVYLRGLCSGGDNSIHVGINGKASLTSENISVPVTNAWAWSKRVTVNIPKIGVNSIEVYMREDGFTFERILFTTASSYVPTGTGPAESPIGFVDTPPPPSTSTGFQQDAGANGLVVMEAESHDSNVNRNSKGWILVNQNGIQFMQAKPDTGARIASNYAATSPYVRFNVNFVKTGKHFLWLRALASGNDNSVHAGNDGRASTTSENISVPVQKTWLWTNNANGTPASIMIDKVGVHTIEIYMREDGFSFDKVLLTTSGTYTPTGSGPAESTKQ
jgi:hypothetical protein